MSVLKAVHTFVSHFIFYFYFFNFRADVTQVYNTHTDNYMWILKKNQNQVIGE